MNQGKSGGRDLTILQRIVRADLTDKESLEQRSEGMRG